MPAAVKRLRLDGERADRFECANVETVDLMHFEIGGRRRIRMEGRPPANSSPRSGLAKPDAVRAATAASDSVSSVVARRPIILAIVECDSYFARKNRSLRRVAAAVERPSMAVRSSGSPASSEAGRRVCCRRGMLALAQRVFPGFDRRERASPLERSRRKATVYRSFLTVDGHGGFRPFSLPEAPR